MFSAFDPRKHVARHAEARLARIFGKLVYRGHFDFYEWLGKIYLLKRAI